MRVNLNNTLYYYFNNKWSFIANKGDGGIIKERHMYELINTEMIDQLEILRTRELKLRRVLKKRSIS